MLCEAHVVPHTLYFLHHGKVNIQTAEEPSTISGHARNSSGREWRFTKTEGGSLHSRKTEGETRHSTAKGKHVKRFRPIEHPGDFVGLYDPHDVKTRAAFEVVAVMASQVRPAAFTCTPFSVLCGIRPLVL